MKKKNIKMFVADNVLICYTGMSTVYFISIQFQSTSVI